MGLAARLADSYGWRDMRAYGRTPWLLTAGTLLMGVGRGVVTPFLVLYLVEQQGISPAFVGVCVTVEFLVRALVGPVAGAVSDQWGRKPVMLAGLLGTSLLLPSYLLVHAPAQLLVLSVANGLLAAHSLYGPASSALVADVVPPGQRGAVFGLIHASRNLGWTLGIALGALLLGQGYAALFLAGGLLPFVFLFVVALLVHEPPVEHAGGRSNPFRAWGALLSSRLFLAYLALTIVFYLGWSHLGNVFPLFLTQGAGLPETAVAVIAINSALIFVLQVPFGRLADRASRSALLAWSALALAGTYAVYAWAPALAPAVPPLWTIAAGVVVFTLAEMLYSPILSAYAADLAPRGTTGSALGVLAFAAAVGQGAPLLVADAVVPRFGWGGFWVLSAALCVPSALGILWLGRRAGPEVDRPSAGA